MFCYYGYVVREFIGRVCQLDAIDGDSSKERYELST